MKFRDDPTLFARVIYEKPETSVSLILLEPNVFSTNCLLTLMTSYDLIHIGQYDVVDHFSDAAI